jgi:hypothetical protein
VWPGYPMIFSIFTWPIQVDNGEGFTQFHGCISITKLALRVNEFMRLREVFQLVNNPSYFPLEFSDTIL